MPNTRVAASFSAWLGLFLSLVAPSTGQDDPTRVGRWDPPRQWPIVGIHAAVLPTGEVLHLTYLEVETELRTAATLWNPASGRFRDVSPGFGDMFCSGQNFLPNGELFIAGGFAGIRPGACNARGVRPVYTFDPFSLQFHQHGTLALPRFYPTLVGLGDGRQLIIGGQGENCQYIPTMEIFDPARGLSKVNGPRKVMRDYPRVFLLSDGSVVHVAPEAVTDIMDNSMRSWNGFTGTRLGQFRFEAAAFYVPGQQDRIMLCGGYTTQLANGDFRDPTATCEVIDPLTGSPAWRSVASMNHPRGDVNAVLLPDGKVLIVGGGEHHRYEGPELSPELYDPATNSWTIMAAQRFGRMYHATAVLLPDGRVLSAGQDDDGSGDGEVSGNWGEIFNPPYLFRGARPAISAAPTTAPLGSDFRIAVSQTPAIRTVVLMGLGTVTHSTNMGQRYVPLEFLRAGGADLQVRMTDNPSLVPPGYYMLFAVNDKGVPSQARMILVTATDPASTCFELTLTRNGRKGGNEPTADPTISPECDDEGTYLADTEIALTARPNEGWEVAGWRGTDNDSSALETNQLTMPAADHTVAVTYERVRMSFSDSFEDPDLCGWSAHECTTCEPVSCASSSDALSYRLLAPSRAHSSSAVSHLERSDERAIDGRYCLRSVYERGSKGKDYLIDNSPGRGGGEIRYETSFWIWPEPGLALKGTNTDILEAVQLAHRERPVFDLFLKPVRGQKDHYALVLQGRDDNNRRITLRAAEIPAGEWHRVSIAWASTSAEGSEDGSIALFLDNEEVQTSTLVNPSLRLDEVRLGQVKGKKRPTQGVVLFDQFESSWGQ